MKRKRKVVLGGGSPPEENILPNGQHSDGSTLFSEGLLIASETLYQVDWLMLHALRGVYPLSYL